MNQQEQATIDLVINGRQAETSLTSVGKAVISLTRQLRAMNEADDPERYAALIAQRDKLSATYKEMDDRVRGAKKSLEELGGETSKFWDRVKSFALGDVIGHAVEGMFDKLKEIVDGSQKAYEEAEITQASLQNKLQQTGEVAGRTKPALDELQKSLMNLTGVDDDVIAKGEDVALTYTNVRGVILDQMIPAAVSLAAAQNNGKVTMESMSAAADGLGKALDNPLVAKRSLRAMGISLNEQLETEIKTMVRNNDMMGAQQLIIDQVNKRYGNLAETLASTETGAAQKFETRIGNIQEVLGKWIVSGKQLGMEVLDPFLSFVEDVVDTPLSETLHEDQRSFLAMRIELESNNTTIERRHEIIDKLKAQYPGYLSQIDSDKTKNSELLPILDKINDAFVLRIAYQSRAEGLDKAIKEQADAMNETYDQKQKLMLQIGTIQQMVSEDGIKFTIKGNNEQEKALYISRNLINAIRDQAKGNKELNNVLASNKYDNLISGLTVYNNGLVSSKQNLKGAQEETKRLTDDLTKFKKESGYNDSIPGADLLATLSSKIKTLQTVMDGTKKGSADYVKMAAVMKAANDELRDGLKDPVVMKKVPGTLNDIEQLIKPKSGPSQAELAADKAAKEAAAKKRADFIASSKELTELYDQFGAEQLTSLMAKNDKEIADAQLKYDNLIQKEQDFIDKAKHNKYANQAEVDAHQDQIDKLRQQKDAKVADIRVKQEQELTDKIIAFRDKMNGKLQTELEKETLLINQEFDQQLKDAGDNQAQKEKIELGRAAALTDAKIREDERFKLEQDKIASEGAVSAADKDNLELAQLNKKYDDEIVALKASFGEKKQATQEFQDAIDAINKNRDAEKERQNKKKQDEEVKSIRAAAVESLQSISSAYFEIGRNNRQRETDADIKRLENLKDKELSNKNLTETQRAAIDDKYRKQEAAIKKKAWEAEKDANLKQAIINGAVAVTKALTSAPWPFNLISAAGAAVAAGAQVAIIADEEAPDFYAAGGLTSMAQSDNPAGYVDVPTLFNKKYVAGEAGPEWIAPNWMLRNPYTANVMGALEALRQQGPNAVSSTSDGSAAGNSPAGGSAPSMDWSPLLNKLDQVHQAIQDQEVSIHYQTFKKDMARLAKLDAGANAKG